ncbi:recombinase family protein [Mesorhizobium qingshengii]|uniref:Site-specific DNA recombinase n=1 Tax=Mesorhizobium qingshengii TaxID=1165689 RepID=A0A1G5ZCZ1_9HYPH|nr:recombinase family protein [Mesorhizobium qingshengii]SDA92446.1 Site-specific DNA recombinase [Mesorhizobium qingshengii]
MVRSTRLRSHLEDFEVAGDRHQINRLAIDLRPQPAAVLEWVREGDTLVVTKLDRLARSVADLVSIIAALKVKGAGLRILAMNLDTATPTGKLMLNLLGSIAEFERELMLERQREGIAKAKAEGKYAGRQPTARAKAKEVLMMRAEGKSVTDTMPALGISSASVFRILAEHAEATRAS